MLSGITFEQLNATVGSFVRDFVDNLSMSEEILLWNTPAVMMLSPWHSARCSSHQA